MVGLLVAIVAVILAVAFIPLAYQAIKVVPEYDRLVVFRLGRSIGHKGPGLVWLWPIVDRAVAVDLREQGLELPHQTTINGQRPHQYRLPRLLADQEIQPPRDVQDAMNRRLSAERTRRATVT